MRYTLCRHCAVSLTSCGDSPAEAASVQTTGNVQGSKGTENLARKFSFPASKLQSATSSGAMSVANNRDTALGQLKLTVLTGDHKGAITSKIKHAIKLAIKLKTYCSYDKQLRY